MKGQLVRVEHQPDGRIFAVIQLSGQDGAAKLERRLLGKRLDAPRIEGSLEAIEQRGGAPSENAFPRAEPPDPDIDFPTGI
ncbi:hypothetical protein MBELCI_1423 [Limimaricola cinnabarinus LL-001]|uniref:Uncharacterized protein n=1 Tax=Limimaricola cinnabarinus LL-001 TaxID=1337093 RepID=U2YKB5_9RHOB|nr:hypothetical protein MBELCI_1423 [Limimaricola cinnabarinus LL-001]